MMKKTLITLVMAAALPAAAMGESSRLYLLGDATGAGWNEWLPEELTPVGNGCFVWDGYLEAGLFKFLDNRGDWGAGIAPGGGAVEIKEGEQMEISRQPYGNNNFSNPEAGWIRMVVNLGDMSVNFRRPALGLTGPAALGWGLGSTVIPLFADDRGRIEWTGQLRPGELKILAAGCRDWTPCYNAPFAGDLLSEGGHAMVYNTDAYKDGEFVDFKYEVPRSGLYTLSFKGEAGGLLYGVDVSLAPEPSLDGAFAAAPGRYLMAMDREARRVHVAGVPTRLYIGTSGSDCQEITPGEPGRFASEVQLKAGAYYKLCYNPGDWDNCVLSPNTDVDISSAVTANVAPMHGFSYTVPEDGSYIVTADFTGVTPSLGADRQILSLLDAAGAEPARVTFTGGELVVDGGYSAMAVYDVAGRIVGDSAPCPLPRGVYIVRVDNNVYKISVK